MQRFQENCTRFDFSKHFVKLNPKMMQDMDTVLSVDLPELMKRFPQDQPSKHLGDLMSTPWHSVCRRRDRRLTAPPAAGCLGRVFGVCPPLPGHAGPGVPISEAGSAGPAPPAPVQASTSSAAIDVWAVSDAQREKYLANFHAAGPSDGRLTGEQVAVGMAPRRAPPRARGTLSRSGWAGTHAWALGERRPRTSSSSPGWTRTR